MPICWSAILLVLIVTAFSYQFLVISDSTARFNRMRNFVIDNGDMFRELIHTEWSHYLSNMVFLISTVYFICKHMGNVWIIIITAFCFFWIYTPIEDSFGISGVLCGFFGALFCVLFFNWKNLKNLEKLSILGLLIWWTSMFIFVYLTRQNINHYAHIFGFLVGLFLSIGFYKNNYSTILEQLRCIISIVFLVFSKMYPSKITDVLDSIHLKVWPYVGRETR